MKKLSFAIIGCGRIAQRHAEHINTYGQLVAVCDIIFKKSILLANKYNSRAYESIEDLLEEEKDLSVVAICSPNGLHKLHSIKALEAGFHVLVEKPMALTVQDCTKMIDVAKQNNKMLFTVKQNRFNPPIVALKEAIDNGVMGKIYIVQLSCFWNRNSDYYENSWKGTKDMDGGTLFTQFSHFIDILYWLMGDIRKVYSISSNFAHEGIIEFEDAGVVAIEFNNGTIGTINYTVNSFKKNMEGSLTLIAEKGTVKIGGQYLNALEYQSIENFVFKDLPLGKGANNYGTYTGSMSNHDKVYEDLVCCLMEGKDITTNALEALKTVEIIERIYQSAIQLN